MILGILSDSHGQATITAEAVEQLVNCGAEQLIHCGDVGSEAVLEELLIRPALVVWGNCDYDRSTLSRYARSLGIAAAAPHGELSCEAGRIGVFHGHEPQFPSATRAGRYRYLLYGHTHLRADQRVGPTRLINPGALHRARVKSVALLDTAKDKLQFLIVK